ncbi:hypothetical protein ASPTUDRAFT_552418 [Aspergillus tubingensis CBS 134.48]|uniref:Uncharacterized protein n=1 Tax=Aspergillus tubingensis (strain CBS 134.48) TaxID=767770 RepID=A0A1L9N704_ASPTC|nr:hypothetical protein ASPTUDRAFT_552418 [Aspergillus tubingensis CBS 134.48]
MTPCVFSLPTSIFPPASPTSSLALISRYSSLVTHHEPLLPNPTHIGRHPLFSGNPGWQSDQGSFNNGLLSFRTKSSMCHRMEPGAPTVTHMWIRSTTMCTCLQWRNLS